MVQLLPQTISYPNEFEFESPSTSTTEISSPDKTTWEQKDSLVRNTDFFFAFNKIAEKDIFEKQLSVFNENRIMWNNTALYDFITFLEEHRNRLAHSDYTAVRWLDFCSQYRQEATWPSTSPSIKEINLERIFEKVEKTFIISNKLELKKFMLEKTKSVLPDFDTDFEGVMNLIDNFFMEQKLDGVKKLELYKDHELEDLLTIYVSISVKGIDVEDCRKLTDELILKIASYNEAVLEYIQFEIVPV